jgi:predicted enzyme related to lactoylglutathione lyase
MPVRLTSIVFQAVDVDRLVYFWAPSLEGWSIESAAGGEVLVRPPEEDGSTLDLVFTPVAPRPKAGKNRVHLDLNSWDGTYQRARDDILQLAGGRPVDIGQGELVPWTVIADPEDNEFCLLKPRDLYRESGAIAAIVVDCADPASLAAFWSAATGWTVVESEPDYAALRDPREPARGPFLEFSRVADRTAEPSPVLLGIESYWAHQHDADVARLLTLGARLVRRHDGAVSYSVLADPEGNEFRVLIPVWPPPPRTRRSLLDGPALHS